MMGLGVLLTLGTTIMGVLLMHMTTELAPVIAAVGLLTIFMLYFIYKWKKPVNSAQAASSC